MWEAGKKVDTEIFIWALIIVFQVAQNYGKWYSELPRALHFDVLKYNFVHLSLRANLECMWYFMVLAAV